MTASGNRAINRLCSDRPDLFTEAQHFVLVSGTHFRPDLTRAQTREGAVFSFHDHRAGGRARQTGDEDIDILRHFAWAIRPFGAAIEKRLCNVGIQVPDRQPDAIS